MADTKISNLPATAGANLTDLLAKVNDPSGVPVTEKVTLEQVEILMRNIIMLAGQLGLVITAPAVPTDDPIVYQDSGLTPLFTVNPLGAVISVSNIETSAAAGTAGFVLRSPDATRWRITVSNLGTVGATPA